MVVSLMYFEFNNNYKIKKKYKDYIETPHILFTRFSNIGYPLFKFQNKEYPIIIILFKAYYLNRVK